MKRCIRGWVLVLLALCPLLATAQIPERFKNLKVLPSDISKPELVGTMREFATALGVRCAYCHVGPDNLLEMDFATDEKAEKRIAREMLRLVAQINGEQLDKIDFPDGRRVQVQCITCHRGVAVPMRIEQILFDAIAQRGADAAITDYLALKQQYHGRAAYDFGAPPLTKVAEQLGRDGEMAPALRIAEFAAAQFPDQSWPQYMLANLLDRNGDRNKAIATYQRVLELEPDHAMARNRVERLQKPPEE